jgi:transcriptional regulator with XRE-family HTH domain
MSISVEVGRRIKRYRQKYNLTLKEIEARVNVSATHVSEIERGKTSPTIGALSRIAKAFDMEPAEFLITEDLPSVALTRNDDRVRIRYEHTKMVANPLTGPVEGQSVSAAIVEWEPETSDADFPARSHAGEEFILVLEGAVEVTVKGRTILMREGDSLHFRADLPHRVVNRFAEPCRAILVMTPVFGF